MIMGQIDVFRDLADRCVGTDAVDRPGCRINGIQNALVSTLHDICKYIVSNLSRGR